MPDFTSSTKSTSPRKQAELYRMVMDDHLCPFGLKSKDLLAHEGFEVKDHHLSSREETAAFKANYAVETTPQTWINGSRIGGYNNLRQYFAGHWR